MDYVIYALATVSIVLAIGGLYSFKLTGHIGLLLSSVVSIGFSILAIILVAWWPLITGFAINWGLRLLGLDPGARR